MLLSEVAITVCCIDWTLYRILGGAWKTMRGSHLENGPGSPTEKPMREFFQALKDVKYDNSKRTRGMLKSAANRLWNEERISHYEDPDTGETGTFYNGHVEVRDGNVSFYIAGYGGELHISLRKERINREECDDECVCMPIKISWRRNNFGSADYGREQQNFIRFATRLVMSYELAGHLGTERVTLEYRDEADAVTSEEKAEEALHTLLTL